MKKILFLILGACLCLTSCDSFLDENPKSSRTSNAYYKTESQARSNVNYLYRTGAISSITGAGSAYVGSSSSISGMLTGYFENSYEGQEIICKYSRLLTRQDHTNEISDYSNGIWTNCYEAINVANTAILKIPAITMDANVAGDLIAEAKFFRAFNYFYLVKTFGDVPLLTVPSDLKTLRPVQSPVADIYTQIQKDLEDAIAVLPAKTFVANAHRISKYTAAMTLADVYFHQGNYAQAKIYAKMVVDSSHSLASNNDQGMNSAYNQLRAVDDLNEVIYCEEFDENISTSNWRPTYAFTSSATAVFGTYSIFERVYGPIDRYLNVYEENDLRIQPNQFFHWTYTNPTNGKTWTAPANQVGCWYYFDEDAMLTTGKGTKDWNVYRLAEAYLDYAESVAQTDGVTADAAEYLAQVQVRAHMDGMTVAEIKAQLMTLSTDEFIHTCWTERLREFPLEYKIWDDCVRTSMFPVISTTEKGVVTYISLISGQNATGATFKETDLVFPISLNELQRNPNLNQNTGYATE